MADAACISLQTVIDYLQTHPEIELARFVLFGKRAYDTFEQVLRELVG
jgi:O-acetyl-ADP-ribose deacetylase (regulator of RNase III)